VLQNTGSCQSPFDAYMHLLGLETLALRMERHCSNALALARFLEGCGLVESVNYPGLAGSPFHEVAGRQFAGRFGALLTVRLGSKQRCFDVIRGLSLARNLANLGDAKTLVIHPASTIYRDCAEQERARAGVTDDLLRISVGIESERDIIRDFEKALKEA
jgi:O-acetylhomoserine (thiol)-lyase